MFKIVLTGVLLFVCYDGNASVIACKQFYQQLDDTVKKEQVLDNQFARIKNFPYLRVNRFWASFAKEDLSASQFDFWLQQLQALAMQAWQIEYANLPIERQYRIRQQLPAFAKQHNLTVIATLEQCSQLLKQADFEEQDKRQLLQQQAIVPDVYSTQKRVLGLHEITKYGIHIAIGRKYKVLSKPYQMPLEEVPVSGKLIRYDHRLANTLRLNANQVSAILAQSSQNPLAVPQPNSKDLNDLFMTFAPVWEVDTVFDKDDRIGTPFWSEVDNLPDVNVSKPKVYQLLSYTRFQQQILLQLNYLVWFPGNTLKKKLIDLEGGRMSGVIWRVTLAPNGKPLVYDTIHQCGCFHMFYPSKVLTALPPTDDIGELGLAPQQDTDFADNARLVLRIAYRTHYVDYVYEYKPRDVETVYYQFADYKQLRSLPYIAGRRSLFRAKDGVVEGSERLMDWVMWPMGVTELGAMRQWGMHATAFTGKRHFDEARLMERYYIWNK